MDQHHSSISVKADLYLLDMFVFAVCGSLAGAIVGFLSAAAELPLVMDLQGSSVTDLFSRLADFAPRYGVRGLILGAPTGMVTFFLSRPYSYSVRLWVLAVGGSLASAGVYLFLEYGIASSHPTYWKVAGSLTIFSLMGAIYGLFLGVSTRLAARFMGRKAIVSATNMQNNLDPVAKNPLDDDELDEWHRPRRERRIE